MVVLESGPAAVMEVVIGFDHEPPVSPKKVDEIRTDPDIDLGPWQPMATTQAQEIALQIAAGAIAIVVADRKTDDARLADCLPQFARRDDGPAS